VHVDLARNYQSVALLCRRYGVARLDVFGSSARGMDFDPRSSDFDFLVEFTPDRSLPPLHQFFGFAESLQQLLGRRVDLIEARAIENPFILAGINQSRELIYAA